MIRKIAHIRQNEGGFVLISLAILMIVLSLAISAYLYTVKTRKEQEMKERTNLAYTTVLNKMASYLATNGSLPCPAARGLAPTSLNYGVSPLDCAATTVAAGSCGTGNNGYCVATNGGQRIRIGIVPFATLKIDAKDAVDAYGNFFTYAVTERQAKKETYVSENGGTISYSYIKDKVNLTDPDVIETNNTTDFAVVSHGPDGAGAFMMSGQANPRACPTTGIDRENCNNDGVFISRNYAPANTTSHFDDQVETVLLDWVYIWDSSYGDTNSSYSRGGLDSNMGVGTENPEKKLHVGGGGNLRIENGKLDAKSLCTEGTPGAPGVPAGPDKCFNPNKLGGSITQGEGMNCNTNEAMIGIANGDSKCGTFAVSEPVACPNNSFFTGLSYSAGAGLVVNCTNAITGAVQPRPFD